MTPLQASGEAIPAGVDPRDEPFFRLPGHVAQTVKALRSQANANTTHGELARMAAAMLEKTLTDCGFDLDGKMPTE